MYAALQVLALVAPLQTSSSGVSSVPDALSLFSAGVERVIADPRDTGLVRLVSDLGRYVKLIERESGEPVPEGVNLATRWILRPFCVNATLDGDGNPNFQVDVRWNNRTQALEELALLRMALAGSGVALSASDSQVGAMQGSTPVGKLSVVVRPDGEQAVLSIALGRTAGPTFRKPAVSLPTGMEPVLSARFDGRALASFVDSFVENEGEDAALAKLILGEFGFAGKDAAPMTFAVGHGAVESISTRHVAGWRKTFFGKHLSGLVDAEHLRLLPEDTLWSWVGNAPPSALVTFARMIAAKDTDEALSMANASTGVNLERDVLNRIGPMVGAFASRGTGGSSGPTGLVGFAQCDEPARVLGTLERLVTRLGKENDMPVEVKKWKHGDDVCTSVLLPGTGMPFEPTFATSGDILFVAGTRSAIKEALDQKAQRDRRTSILDHPRIKELPAGALQDLIAFGFNDTPEALERGYGLLTMLQSSLGSMMQGAGVPPGAQDFIPDISELLPSFTALSRGARPSLTLTYVHGNDLLQAITHDSSLLARATAMAGSPMGQVQPMALPVIAAVAIPRLLSARLSANESAAISSLRAISSAQAQFQSAAVLDVDLDGTGEYGLFTELSGARPLRGYDERLDPAVLSPAWGDVQADGCGGAVLMRSGYVFQMWLPGGMGAVCDTPLPGPVAVDPSDAEDHWRCYAWPVELGSTGLRAFYIDETGELYFLSNTTDVTPNPYHGTCASGGRQPKFDAASTTRGRFDARPPAAGSLGSDGEPWMQLQ